MWSSTCAMPYSSIQRGCTFLLTAQVTRARRRLAVICAEGPVRRVIELARLVETLGVVSSLHESELRPTDGNPGVKAPDEAAPAA
jgi:hypothetical protein